MQQVASYGGLLRIRIIDFLPYRCHSRDGRLAAGVDRIWGHSRVEQLILRLVKAHAADEGPEGGSLQNQRGENGAEGEEQDQVPARELGRQGKSCR